MMSSSFCKAPFYFSSYDLWWLWK